MKQAFLQALCLTALLALSPWHLAHGAAEAPSGPSTGVVYVPLAQPFITNYDGGGRLKYLKTEVTLRVRTPTDNLVRQHMPYIRNRLVMLFASRLEEHLTSTEGKEQLRLQALQEVKAALDFLERPGTSNNIQDLYFTNYVVQR